MLHGRLFLHHVRIKGQIIVLTNTFSSIRLRYAGIWRNHVPVLRNGAEVMEYARGRHFHLFSDSLMKHAQCPDIQNTTISRAPHAFLDRGGNPIMLRADVPELLGDLTRMYLLYEPRGTFSGLPPVPDNACITWVKEICQTSAGLMAMSFEHKVAGHAALFPIRDGICELLIVAVPQKQHNGIGTQLLHSLIRKNREQLFINT
jgi:hypothetical protein